MSQVAYLGPEGTFSGILARQRFGKKADLNACGAIDGVFESVLSGSTPLGLVPVENSSGGTVYDTIDLLIRHSGSIFILEEISLDIRIALLGHKGTAVQTVYSHFTQIKHHAEWLKIHHPDATLVPVASTATASERAAADPKAAALASPGAAEIYKLDILATPSDGQEVNVTNFFIIARKPLDTPTPNRTALAATLQNQCGSLHKFLGPFARQKVTLTRIVSRPVPGQPQTYVFYIELEGAEEDPAVARALELANRQAQSISILGTFPLGRRFRS
ncbi:MAG: chorismate mutase [Verrucomicrobia bacterium]|nr:chorismate mutase [Verrucomicrobiota bacterium]